MSEVSLDTSRPVAPDAATAPTDEARLREAAQAFESLLVQMLVREMREAQLEHGFFGDTPGASIYEAMFEQHLAERLAEDSPLDIASMLLEQWSGGGAKPADLEQVLREVREATARKSYGSAQVPAGATDPMTELDD